MRNRLANMLAILLCSVIGYSQPLVENINITSSDQIPAMRQALTDSIWSKNKSVITPKAKFTENINLSPFIEENYPWIQSISSVDKLSIRLKNRIESIVYILHPKVSNRLNIPIIYHGGHGGGFWEDKNWNNASFEYSVSVYKFFLDRGFDVICLDMPLHGNNKKSYVVNDPSGKLSISEHGDLFKLPEPFYYFFEPVKQTVDFLEKKYGYLNFAMLGLSGGGWATTLYSAVDTRITHSYAIAGSTPLDFRTHPNDWGDLEQNYTPFYDKFNYSTLYTLAAAGKNRMHYQVLLKNDQCCFAVDGSPWETNVQATLANLGGEGSYEFMFDTSANKHMISSVTLDNIYYHLTNSFIKYNVPFDIEIANRNTTRKTFSCFVDTIVLKNVIPGEDIIQWYKDFSPLESESYDRMKVHGPGKYFARVENISGITMFSDTLMVDKFPAPRVSQLGKRLYSNFKRGNQWYLNGTPIPLSTGEYIQPMNTGAYSVVANTGTCTSEHSNTFYFGTVVFPNPAKNQVTVQVNSSVSTVKADLINLNGQIVLSTMVNSLKLLQFPPDIKKGMHFLKLYNNAGFYQTIKIMVQ